MRLAAREIARSSAGYPPATVSATLFATLLLLGPPELPPVDAPVGEPTPDAPGPEAGGGEGPTDELEDNPEWDAPEEVEPAPEPEPTPEPAPEPEPAAEPEPEPEPAPEVQQPAAVPAPVPAPAPETAAEPETPAPGPAAEAEEDPWAEHNDEAEDRREKKERREKFGGIKFFRLGIYGKTGYTHGTSQRNGLFDRQKSIDASIENMEATMVGGGDLGRNDFGGWQYGFEVDLEVFFVNAWLDFHKFYNPGGMWSLLIGYDHEFRLHDRIYFNLGLGGGMMRVFLGDVLEDLYFDRDNPEAINIATAGLEARGLASFDFRIAGPLFFTPSFLLGYHYLWSADAEAVTAERGLHYAAQAGLKLMFMLPRESRTRPEKKKR